MQIQRNNYQLRLNKLLSLGIVKSLILILPVPIKVIVKQKLLRDVKEPQIHQDEFINVLNSIRNLNISSINRTNEMEEFLCSVVGLNNESLHQQPSELTSFFGKGLHLWQYPNQLSSFLLNEAENLKSVNRYIEIGSRWCGTFILISEILYKLNPDLKEVIAVDVIEQPRVLTLYAKYLNENGGPKLTYSMNGSEFLREFCHKENQRTLCFIDGDHSLEGVMRDHEIAVNISEMIVHHDVYSDATPQIRRFWNFIQTLQSQEWNFREYVQQYNSVSGNYLGIGFMIRKNTEIKKSK